MKNYKFNNIFCLIVLAISLVTIGAFIALNQWAGCYQCGTGPQ